MKPGRPSKRAQIARATWKVRKAALAAQVANSAHEMAGDKPSLPPRSVYLQQIIAALPEPEVRRLLLEFALERAP